MSATESRRNVVSYAICIAAFASGIGFAGYHKLFGRHLGINVTTDKMFHKVIEEAYPHITEMLNEEMKSLPTDKLGSWQRAVTTSDGCWHISFFFFSEWDLRDLQLADWSLVVVWPCMHERLRPHDHRRALSGNSKVNRGVSRGVLFEKAKEEGCTIAINWQDQDSSSEKSFRAVHL